jgi:hypothetical protein
MRRPWRAWPETSSEPAEARQTGRNRTSVADRQKRSIRAHLKARCATSPSMSHASSMQECRKPRPLPECTPRHGCATWSAISAWRTSRLAGKRNHQTSAPMIPAAMTSASCCDWMIRRGRRSTRWPRTSSGRAPRSFASSSRGRPLRRFPRAGTYAWPNATENRPGRYGATPMTRGTQLSSCAGYVDNHASTP